ncbi:hypothetical protein SFC79_10515 [Nocardioides sp. S-58]|uniref:Uncharacterized protein n=1 Tax=Nocardioides renjunii TaxID=3095075 RepID=A0ABU5KBH7_9ACTN|nr:hypothetical protein [Nocardioides sp. S-58]MDZ5662197.1 hypothetical protein [Nocardioides sp. S-58]
MDYMQTSTRGACAGTLPTDEVTPPSPLVGSTRVTLGHVPEGGPPRADMLGRQLERQHEATRRLDQVEDLDVQALERTMDPATQRTFTTRTIDVLTVHDVGCPPSGRHGRGIGAPPGRREVLVPAPASDA